MVSVQAVYMEGWTGEGRGGRERRTTPTNASATHPPTHSDITCTTPHPHLTHTTSATPHSLPSTPRPHRLCHPPTSPNLTSDTTLKVTPHWNLTLTPRM
ncbi:hypothetical protein Pcinc_037426 [Petrolisthes cinctipes]|uniref:Uncharacterized protein n=1 Tax=Petrolisthes cinctipes TaxID=88211 RepID=A0AAE1ELE7_PETCI|nr:hypothetical protein Pcinc_037426 [Petrolisthes cinctipes]